MPFIPFLVKDDFEPLGVRVQVDDFGNPSVNCAFIAIAQEVARLLQQAYPVQSDDSTCYKTVAIRAIEPEYKYILGLQMPTERELEVLQMIVDGNSNSAIARKLYISVGTVKTHIRNILKKLCASDLTQAAIQALRAGLIR